MKQQVEYDENGRKCSCCNKYKPWDNFAKNPNGFNGKRADCSECRSLKRALDKELSNFEEIEKKRHADYEPEKEVTIKKQKAKRANSKIFMEIEEERNATYWRGCAEIMLFVMLMIILIFALFGIINGN